jgi:hypothetical protein
MCSKGLVSDWMSCSLVVIQQFNEQRIGESDRGLLSEREVQTKDFNGCKY